MGLESVPAESQSDTLAAESRRFLACSVYIICTSYASFDDQPIEWRWPAGAAKGIGLACASCLGHEGAKVVVADVDEEGAKR